MTNKEAIHDIKKSLKVDGSSGDIILIKPLQPQTIDKIIKALEQKPILDKIRAEIEQLPTTKCTETRRIYIDADKFKENALAIIDKYKGESENT